MAQSPKADTRLLSSPADEQRLIDELRGLKARRSPRAPRLAKAARIVQETASPRVRNAAALALADMQAFEGKGALIELLARPSTKGARGTLLYSLSQLKATVPITVLAKIIVEDTYEAREEALDLINRGRIEGTADDFIQAQGALMDALATVDEERSAAIRRALSYLARKHR